MMKNKLLITLLISCLYGVSYAQLASPDVDAGNGGQAAWCPGSGVATSFINFTPGNQTTAYTVKEIPYNPPYSFDPVPGSTLIPIPTTGNQDDFWADDLFTLPFAFNFWGNSYTNTSIGSNGVICFNTTGAYAPGEYCPYPVTGGLPNGTTIRNAIFGILQDINFTDIPYPGVTTINYYVYDQGQNVAPGRVFIFNVNKVLQFGDGTNPDTNAAGVQTYQMVLYETTNIIDVYVKRRVPYNPWFAGRGIIGLINNAGNQWIAAPGCNGTNFTAIGKAFRFTPAGPQNATIQWTLNGNPIPNSNVDNVAVPNTVPGDILEATVTYNNPGAAPASFSSGPITVQPNFVLPQPGPVEKITCPGNNGPYTFNASKDSFFLDGVPNPTDYEIAYYENYQDADDYANNYITNINAYPVNASDLPKTIYVRVTEIASGSGCYTVQSFTLEKEEPVGTISYDPVICRSSASSAPVHKSATFTEGGEFVGSSPDLFVNPVTGDIDLDQTIGGTYTVDYYYTPECPNYKSSFTFTIVDTPTAQFDSTSGSVCPGVNSPLSFSGTIGATITYTKTDATNGIETHTTTIQGNGTAVDYYPINEETVFELQKVTTATSPSCEYVFAPGTTVTFDNDAPSATIVDADDSDFCPGGSTLINIQGTAGGTVNYTGPSGTGTVVIDPNTGKGSFSTQALTTQGTYTYTLTDITNPNCPTTAEPITGQSITITVNPLPVLQSFSPATPTVCPGDNVGLNFVGTPNATVNFHDSNNTPLSYVIPAGGSGQAQYPASTYILDNITSADLCVTPLTQSITVGLDVPPSITTDPVNPPAICEGGSFTLNVVATGTNLTYEWKHGTNTVQNGPSNTYTKTNALLADLGDYNVIVHGKCTPDAISGMATVSIAPGPHFVTQPVAPAENCIGGDIQLTVTTTNTDNNTTYDWRKDGVSIGETTDTLDIIGLTAADNGTQYTVVVTNPGCGSITSVPVTVNVGKNTEIITQPVTSLDLCESDPLMLSVTAVGEHLQYIWRRNNQVVQSGPSNSYTVNNTDVLTDSGTYDVIVEGTCGTPTSVTSTATVVNIFRKPTIVSQPQGPSSDLCTGMPLTLTVQASGDITTYQWQRNGVNVGTNSNTYSDPSVVATEVSDSYICIISNPYCDPVSTIPVLVKVNVAPIIDQQPVSQTVCVDEQINLTVQVTVTGNVTYRWQHDGVDVGTNAPTYQVEHAALSDSGVYRCIIKNDSCPAVYSDPVTVLVRPLPDATIANGMESTICDNTGTDVIFTGTPNAIVTYTVNGGENQTITLNPSGSARLLTGVLGQTTTYSLVSVAANNNPPCPKALTGEAIVTVQEIPDPELDQDGYICLDPVSGQTMTGSFYELNTGLTTAQGYEFVWYLDDVEIPGATEGAYNAVAQGSYKVIITDTATGCTDSAMAPITTSTPPLTITAQVDTLFFADNASIIVTAQPASTDYEYRLDDGPWQSDNIFTGVRTVVSIDNSGDHTVYVRDSKACDELSYDVKVIDYPKYFTPNGDGFHDTWNISTLSNQPNAKIFIFDRYGKLLKQISTTNPTGWDGTYNGQPMAADDYWFVVKYTEQGINKEFKAHFAIKR
ncbi:T9SS type B sorting domain-containing protein [Flavobacterium pallidum]|uniref:Ig-like domain-containing protein n=1 Tax=Flavobacterium pallidum TaxID=2172098 RepID=A0A2S1SKR7_9FLAO|nr:T9SS type B sorting domain-containing protein [Flavobacterium pallidum]AWI26998.1 hypothetical protein HYN49_14390 [Flavobacterium pallidum]